MRCIRRSVIHEGVASDRQPCRSWAARRGARRGEARGSAASEGAGKPPLDRLVMVAPWRRDSYVLGGGPADVALIALSSVKLPDPLPVSRGRHGMPDDGDGADSVVLAAR